MKEKQSDVTGLMLDKLYEAQFRLGGRNRCRHRRLDRKGNRLPAEQ